MRAGMATQIPGEIQLWYKNRSNSQLLEVAPIRTSNKRKRQLLKNKEVLFKNNHVEVGFITVLKDCL